MKFYLSTALAVLLTMQMAFAETQVTLIQPEQASIQSPAPVSTATSVAPTTVQPPAYKNYQIDTTKSVIPLNSRLKKTYSGYSYTIANNSTDTLELLHAEIINGMSGQGAALGAQKSSAAAIGTAIGGGLLLGVVTFGITFLAGLLASPFIYGANHHQNTKTTAEGLKFPNQVPTGIVNPGSTIQFTTLTPVDQIPQVKMTFRNINNNELFSVTQ